MTQTRRRPVVLLQQHLEDRQNTRGGNARRASPCLFVVLWAPTPVRVNPRAEPHSLQSMKPVWQGCEFWRLWVPCSHWGWLVSTRLVPKHSGTERFARFLWIWHTPDWFELLVVRDWGACTWKAARRGDEVLPEV